MTAARPALPDPDAMMHIVERIASAATADPALRSVAPDRLMRHVPGKRAIVSAHWAGRPVVLRLALDPADPGTFREWDEMQRIWPAMNDGPYRIAEPLHLSAAHGLLITEAVAGPPLMQEIWQTEPAARAVHLAPAAAWLRAYTRGTDTAGKSRAGLWLDKAQRAAARQPHPRLQRRERKILKHLQRLADPCERVPWRSAICHGDFHPNNLIHNQGRYTGIDLGGSAVLTIYKDMARFLMHMGRRGLIPSGEARFGVDARGLAAFADAFELSDTERDLILPFMLGCEALLRVEHAGIKPGRVRRACEMSDQLIADLAQI